MQIIEDKAQQEGKHTQKREWFQNRGIEVIRYPLPVGDYVLVNEKAQDVISRKANRGMEPKKMDFLGSYTVTVDTKKDIQELCGDICGKSHDRFRDECILAQNNGIKLYILVENRDGIQKLEDLPKWKNPRLYIRKNGVQLYPRATKGVSLMKSCWTMRTKYGVEFLFCTPEESAEKVLELLGGDENES